MPNTIITEHELKVIASMRAGIAAARAERTTFYGFYTGEYAMELWDDFFTVLPCLLFECNDTVAVTAYQRTILTYVRRMESILADATQEA